jgi:hypothetical protein
MVAAFDSGDQFIDELIQRHEFCSQLPVCAREGLRYVMADNQVFSARILAAKRL